MSDEKFVIEVENIERLADLAQMRCYPNGAHEKQLAETKQFYMMGFFEGLQMGNKLPKEGFDFAFQESAKAIQRRIKELMNS